MGSSANLDPPPSGGRRRRLAPLPDSYAASDPQRNWRGLRQPPSILDLANDHKLQAASVAPRIERKSSRMSLFNLFSKPKVERARGHHEQGLPALPETKAPLPPSAAPPLPPPTHRALPRATHAPPAPAPVENPVLKVTSVSMPVQQPRGSMDPNRLKPLVTGSISRRPGGFDPPPLFQAYPQAIKHATLSCSIPSAEAVLKLQAQRRNRYSLLDSRSKLDLLAEDVEVEPQGKRSDRARLSTKRLSSAMLPFIPDPNKKIYILITAGYVLQYAGSGSSDRLPEKVLPLGPDSAAFASDLIPGKHWVLQISEIAREDGTVAAATQTRSLLAKLRLQSSSNRRHVSNFLLILESPEEMDSWLTVVRRTIDSMGGTSRKDEAEVKAAEKEVAAARQRQVNPTHRYLAQKDARRFSGVDSVLRTTPIPYPSQPSPIVTTSDWEKASGRSSSSASASVRDPDSFSMRSRRTSMRQSSEVGSPASANEQNAAALANLPAGSRLSVMSLATTASGAGTTAAASTSRGPSPCDSPRCDSFSIPEVDSRSKALPKTPLPISTHRRRSVQMLSTTDEDAVSLPIQLPPCPTTLETTVEEEASPEPDVQLQYSRPRRNSPPNRIINAKYRSSSLPPPQIPLPPLPVEGQRQGAPRSRPQSIIGGVSAAPPGLPMHSSRRTPSPLPPTISEDSVDDFERIFALPLLAEPEPCQYVLSNGTEKPTFFSRPLERSEKASTNFSLPTSPEGGKPSQRNSLQRLPILSPEISPMTTPTIGTTPTTVSSPSTANGSPPTRVSSGSKPCFRPVPIRTSDSFVPRRYSSMLPPPLPLAVSVNSDPSIPSSRTRAQQAALTMQAQQQAKTLRRPTSMQIGSDRTPFLAATRNFNRSVSANAALKSTVPSTTSPPQAMRVTSFDILAPPPYAQLKLQRSTPAFIAPMGPPPDAPLPVPPRFDSVASQIAV